jgi:four helix bundle protein
MKVKRFEDLIAWQKAMDLAVMIYERFNGLKDYGFKDQICRAVVSISNNIAEGFDRISTTDSTRFLVIARGSCNEVKSMLYLAERLNYLPAQGADQLIEKCNEISKIIYGLIRSPQK